MLRASPIQIYFSYLFKGIRYGSIPQPKKFIRATLHILFISKSDVNMLYITPGLIVLWPGAGGREEEQDPGGGVEEEKDPGDGALRYAVAKNWAPRGRELRGEAAANGSWRRCEEVGKLSRRRRLAPRLPPPLPPDPTAQQIPPAPLHRCEFLA